MNMLSTMLLISAGLIAPLHVQASVEPGDAAWVQVFDSELAAVLDAVSSYNPVSVKTNVEYLGAIYKQVLGGAERYAYTVGVGEPGRETVTVSLRLPPDSELLAFWHTHGASHWTRNYFSDVDTALANQWGVPLYLATPQGELRVFQPEDRVMGRLQARRMGLGGRGGVAAGKLIGII